MNAVLLFFFVSPRCSHCYAMGETVDSLFLCDSVYVRTVVDSAYVKDVEKWGFKTPVIPNGNMKEEWEINFYPQIVAYFPESEHAFVVAEGETKRKVIIENLAKAIYVESLYREKTTERQHSRTTLFRNKQKTEENSCQE